MNDLTNTQAKYFYLLILPFIGISSYFSQLWLYAWVVIAAITTIIINLIGD